MQNYEGVHGRLPPAAVCGKDGQPLLSWRVLLLPYMEEGTLYEQFHLNEPWNSPNNLPLVEKMPYAYRAPGRKACLLPPGHTVCHVFVGPGTAFEHASGHFVRDFTDGQSNTLLIIEAGPPVPWTKPDELSFSPRQPLAQIDTVFKDGFRFAMADGSVHWFKKEMRESSLRELILRNSGQQVKQFWRDARE